MIRDGGNADAPAPHSSGSQAGRKCPAGCCLDSTTDPAKELAMPTTTTTTTTEAVRPDTRDMVMVHNTFRRCFGDLPGLVRGVAAGDTERAAVVADFFTEVATGLHHHHTNEDEYLWPMLLDRVPADQEFVLRAEEQHQRVAGLLETAQAQVGAFRAGARVEIRDAFAATLIALDAALCEHMADEERYILPLAEANLTVAEWEGLGERGRAGMPKDRMLVQVGYLVEGLPADQRRHFLRRLPLLARVAWLLVGRRTYEQEIRRIYGR
jgi:hemerythrin-like domain-containing protein